MRYPASRKCCGSVVRCGCRARTCVVRSSTPCVSGRKPVRMDAREGAQFATAACACKKVADLAENESMEGVRAHRRPYAPKSALRSSMRSRRMFNRSGSLRTRPPASSYIIYSSRQTDFIKDRISHPASVVCGVCFHADGALQCSRLREPHRRHLRWPWHHGFKIKAFGVDGHSVPTPKRRICCLCEGPHRLWSCICCQRHGQQKK